VGLEVKNYVLQLAAQLTHNTLKAKLLILKYLERQMLNWQNGL
jgi:hypothetical protein